MRGRVVTGGALLLVGVALAAGCSGETWRRTGYETLQNMQAQECQAQPGQQPCPPRQTYEEYRRDRQEAVDPQ